MVFFVNKYIHKKKLMLIFILLSAQKKNLLIITLYIYIFIYVYMYIFYCDNKYDSINYQFRKLNIQFYKKEFI